MMTCDAIQRRLAEDVAEAAEAQADVRRHLAGCPDCTRVLDDLKRVDAALHDLPEHDAPDVLAPSRLRR